MSVSFLASEASEVVVGIDSGGRFESIATSLARVAPVREVRPTWDLEFLSGRLVELSAREGGAGLTLATTLVRQAQLRGELAGWISTERTRFYPPDLADCGVDLAQLPVIVLPERRDVPVAADDLIRSGSFALVILDLVELNWGRRAEFHLSAQTRLAGLAKRHNTALVCLTEKSRNSSSLGSLVSLRAETRRRALSEGRYACELEVLKDKRHGLGWSYTELRRGPDGLC